MVNKFKKSRSDRLFDCIIYVIAFIVLIIALYPLWYVVIASISSPLEVVQGNVRLFPKGFNLNAYASVFSNSEILNGYYNTIKYTLIGTLINLVMTTAGAYPLSKADLYGKGFIITLVTITMFFSGGMIPSYLLINNLHMIDTIWAMVLPGAISVWNMFIMRNFFQNSIPEELIESAYVDGCTNIRTLISIVLPLSKAIIAVMTIFYAVGHWNSYFNALLYINKRENYPLQIVLREILLMGRGVTEADSGGTVVNSVDDLLMFESLKYTVIIVASLPVIVLYPVMQKYFVTGMMVGSIKG